MVKSEVVFKKCLTTFFPSKCHSVEQHWSSAVSRFIPSEFGQFIIISDNDILELYLITIEFNRHICNPTVFKLVILNLILHHICFVYTVYNCKCFENETSATNWISLCQQVFSCTSINNWLQWKDLLSSIN